MDPLSPQSRRDFLQRVGAAVAASATLGPWMGIAAESPPKVPAKALVGSNIYGWNQYAERDKKPLDLEGVMSALRDAGYDYLENYLNVKDPEANGKFAERLRAKGLQPVSLYTSAVFHDPAKVTETLAPIVAAANICQRAGFQVIVCNAESVGREKTDEELQTQTATLAQLGDALNSLGMKLALHQHLPEMANDAREFHYIFDHTKPDLVGWCFDVNWVAKGGVLPLDALQQYGNRVATCHLRQSRGGVWWEDLDSGDIDYEAVAKYIKEHHLAQRLTVELAIEPGTKITRSVVENHLLSRQYVRKVFGV